MYLSIVTCSRNDNHGGQLTRRMQIFINALAAQCERHSLSAELIIVEWNPPTDKDPIAKAFNWPKQRGPLEIRVITVSPELHAQFQCSKNLPLFQMIAKNVGIQRARGEWVLVTNIDIIFNDALMAYLATQKLDPNCHYRIDRTDVESEVPLDASLDEQLEYCRNHLIRTNAREGVFKIAKDGQRQLFEKDIWLNSLETGSQTQISHNAVVSFAQGFYPPQSHPVSKQAFRPILNNAVINFEKEFAQLSLDLEIGLNCQQPAKIQITTESGTVHNYQLVSRDCFTIPNPGRRLTIAVTNGDLQVAGVVVPYNLVLHRLSPQPLTRPLLRLPINAMFQLKQSLSALFAKSRSAATQGPFYPPRLHTNACGDFALFSKQALLKLQGYPEFEMYSMHIDSLLVFQAHFAGFKEVQLTEPMRIYHIEHGAGWTQDGESKLFDSLKRRGIGYLDYPDLMRFGAEMAAQSAPLEFTENREEWGLANHQLPEVKI